MRLTMFWVIFASSQTYAMTNRNGTKDYVPVRSSVSHSPWRRTWSVSSWLNSTSYCSNRNQLRDSPPWLDRRQKKVVIRPSDQEGTRFPVTTAGFHTQWRILALVQHTNFTNWTTCLVKLFGFQTRFLRFSNLSGGKVRSISGWCQQITIFYVLS